MAGPFDRFNRQQFTLHRQTSPTSGHFDTNDRWVAPTITDPLPLIQGHISMVDRLGRESKWDHTQAGTIEMGTLRFYTETLLQKGDIVEAGQEGGVIYRYRVTAMVRAHRLIAKQLSLPVRYEFTVDEVPQ